MRFSGPLSVVDTALAELAEAVVREGVSDAASRSATTLAVTVAVGDEVCIELVDDGPGTPAGLADGAIADLRSRTEDAGGSLGVEAVATGGTRLRWCAPLPA